MMGHNQQHGPPSLNPGAEYGALPFDQFVLANWDMGKAQEQDQEQWNGLARRWLSMSHVDRSPFWEICGHPEWSPPVDAPYLPTQPQIQRILAPHQTVTERNVTQNFLNHAPKPVWIRTCYTPELDAAYRKMFEDGQTDFGPEIVLDDENLYGQFGHDWTKVFLRLPQLPDTVIYHNEGHPENDDQWQAFSSPGDEAMLPLQNAAEKCRSVHYLFDEEALQEKLVKVHFVDIHGQSVWYNKIRPEKIQTFEVFPGGDRLSLHLENCDAFASLLQPGTLLYADDSWGW